MHLSPTMIIIGLVIILLIFIEGAWGALADLCQMLEDVK